MYQFAFIMDQQVGLRTQSLNFERVVALDPEIAPTWIPVLYEADTMITKLPGLPSGVRGTLRGVQEIRAGLRDQKPDAVLWATWAAKSAPDQVAVAPAFLVMDMTPVQMEAMGEHYGYTRKRAQFMAQWKRRATDRLYASATHFFPWNDWVAESLRSDYGVPSEKILPVSPGVDTELFRPSPDKTESDGVVRILFVGGDFERKGGDLLLRWMETTQVSHPWEVHIVTRDPNLKGDSKRLHIYRNLANNGDELVRLYQKCDIFVLPTRADCYSLVAMEAMASGLPVVISRLGGIPDIVEEGKTGYLLNVNDTETLFARLDTLVEDTDLRKSLGVEARHRACERFDSRINVSRILEFMKASVGKSVREQSE